EQLADLQTQSYEQQLQWLEQLRQYRDSLLLNEQLTTLTPEQQFAAAQQQYLATVAAAAAGDANAQQQLQQAAQAYLEEARSFLGDSQGYTDIFNSVLNTLDEFIATGGATIQQQIAELLTDIANSPLAQPGAMVTESPTLVSEVQSLQNVNQ